MPFLVTPGCDLDGAADARIRIDDARGFKGIDDAESFQRRAVDECDSCIDFNLRRRLIEQRHSGKNAFDTRPRVLD